MAVIKAFECIRPDKRLQTEWRHFLMMYTTERKR